MTATTTPRPGPWAWAAVAAGWAIMAWAVVGVFGDAGATHPGSWFTWVVGLAVLHDGVLLPVVAFVGGFLVARAPGPWRMPARVALVTIGVLALVTLPVVTAVGARSDNPSLLPLPAGRNLAVVAGSVAAAGLLAGFLRARSARRAATTGSAAGGGGPT